MKLLTQIFQALLGVAALICTALIAVGRLVWRTIRNYWQRCSRWYRRLLATLLVVMLVSFIALIAYAYYENEYGRCYIEESLSEDVDVYLFRDDMYRVYNCQIGRYTTPKINWVSDVPENDTLAVYAIPEKRGYINVKNGEIVIDAETNNYSRAWVFSEGLAAVERGGKIGFINAHNEVVIPFKFDFVEASRMINFGYSFHNGYCAMTNKDGYWGIIDSMGEWIIEPIYDEIWAPCDSGYRVAVKDGRYGLLDAKCAVVYPTEYIHIDIVSDGFVLTKDGKRWQEDCEGNIVNNFMFTRTDYVSYPTGYDEAGDMEYEFTEYMIYYIGEYCGIMSRITGESITPAIYSYINMLSKDLFEVQDSESCDWYLLDVNGNIVSRK